MLSSSLLGPPLGSIALLEQQVPGSRKDHAEGFIVPMAALFTAR